MPTSGSAFPFREPEIPSTFQNQRGGQCVIGREGRNDIEDVLVVISVRSRYKCTVVFMGSLYMLPKSRDQFVNTKRD